MHAIEYIISVARTKGLVVNEKHGLHIQITNVFRVKNRYFDIFILAVRMLRMVQLPISTLGVRNLEQVIVYRLLELLLKQSHPEYRCYSSGKVPINLAVLLLFLFDVIVFCHSRAIYGPYSMTSYVSASLQMQWQPILSNVGKYIQTDVIIPVARDISRHKKYDSRREDSQQWLSLSKAAISIEDK